MKERNLVDLLINQANQYHGRAALRVKRGARYQDISWNEFLEQVMRISEALRRSGIHTGDRVAIYSENRPEWAFADLAILALGAVVVPVYPTASLKEVEHVLTHSGTSVVFVSTPEKLDSLSHLGENLRKVVVFDAVFEGHGTTPRAFCASTSLRAFARALFGKNLTFFSESVREEPDVLLRKRAVSLADFIASVLDSREALFNQFQNDVAQVGLDDLATIIYTSGTTGLPKGVMLTHRNFLINCYDAREALPITDQDVSLSFLPLAMFLSAWAVIICICFRAAPLPMRKI